MEKRLYHVNISELKRRFSFYLGEVKKGFEIIVCKRNVPFARIVLLSEEERKS
ncbi:MAG: type II toxin-antitoxin system prevent-host-death family antitoxin [Chloracidobacterium sp.]|nr:type II toxin-antitoxin system prevent-host-death family antitoxin [Chloracidobacterium sp.]